jgi:hypothetical protein
MFVDSAGSLTQPEGSPWSLGPKWADQGAVGGHRKSSFPPVHDRSQEAITNSNFSATRVKRQDGVAGPDGAGALDGQARRLRGSC